MSSSPAPGRSAYLRNAATAIQAILNVTANPTPTFIRSEHCNTTRVVLAETYPSLNPHRRSSHRTHAANQYSGLIVVLFASDVKSYRQSAKTRRGPGKQTVKD